MMMPPLPVMIGAIFGVILLVSSVPAWIYGRKTRRWLPLKIALSLVVASFLFLGVTVGIGHVPSYVFYRSFGFIPTHDVTGLKGLRLTFSDSGMSYLRFNASPETFNKIVSRKFVETTEEGFRSEIPIDTPEWWRPFDGKPNRFYIANNLDEDFSYSSRAIIAYDESTRVVHLKWLGLR